MKEQNDSSQVTPNAENGIKKERQEKELEMRRRLEAERNPGEGRFVGIPVEQTEEPLRGRIESSHKKKEGICNRLLSKLGDKIFAADDMGYTKKIEKYLLIP
ncbi:MAG: hypothetical protein K2I27_03465 [Bacteroides sp.]|nr:hypothetical protein [Bacteroides sp.]